MAFDEELLRTAVQRRGVLAALAEEPHDRRDLQADFDISKATCHRIVRSFEEYDLVRRTDGGYTLTPLGDAVAAQVAQFDSGVRTATRLAPLLDAFAAAPVSFDVALFTDAAVTRPSPADPSAPVDRHLELLEETTTVRTLDTTSFAPPLYVERMLEKALDGGGRGVVILPETVVEQRLSRHTEMHRRAAKSGVPVRYRVCDDVPFGLTVFDADRVALRAYDGETGSVTLLAETDDPDAVAWAIDVFDHYYDRSDPAAAVDAFPDWLPAAPLEL